ncbi:MAG TPA: PilN domain-containing protein [Coxiellaceae bacterium]|nr:MAG: hypothetical protein A3E81_08435 [Gammaproteobacteria bacterium RIFCSPHIGHO2_12_FULL_36_30]HLB55756.1 PilN domain-containing protein [Coxiellaceae bacterium]
MNINLLPWRDEIIAINKKIFLRLMLFAVALSFIFLFFIHHILYTDVNYTENYISALQSANARLAGNVATYLDKEKMQKEIAARFLVLQNLQMSRFDDVRLLNDIVETTPKGIYLTTMSRDGNQIILSGSANSNLLVSQFMEALRVSPNMEVTSLQKVEKNEGDKLTITHFDLYVASTLPRLTSEAAAAEKKQKDELEKMKLNNPIKILQEKRDDQNKKIDDQLKPGGQPIGKSE